MTAVLMQIEMPTVTRATGSKYPFEALEVDGPALVETDVIDATKVSSRLQSALAAAKKRSEVLRTRTFRVRVFKVDGQDRVGVWRTS